jgi:plasmid maintenance system antidote protein VapI
MATKTYAEDDLIRILKDKIADMGLTGAAASMSMAPSYLSDIVNGNRSVSAAVALKMGFEREVKKVTVFREVK